MSPLGDAAQAPFTQGGDPRAEAYIHDLLGRLLAIVHRHLSPHAVYLVGSFGRGEGTVRFGDDGTPKLWRDIDLILVFRTRARTSSLNRVRREALSLPGVRAGETTITGADISLAQLPRALALRWRDLKMLELATNSRLLSGRDLRPRMAVVDGRIPPESGQRFLHQKAIGLCLMYERIMTDPAAVNYEVSKLYVEAVSALASLEGSSASSFSARVQSLASSSDPDIRRIALAAGKWGAFKAMARGAAMPALDPVSSWKQGRDDLVTSLKIVHRRLWGDMPALDTPEGLRTYYERLSRRFIPVTLGTAMTRSFPLPRTVLSLGRLARIAYSFYSRMRFRSRVSPFRGCPLSAVYTGALALAANLDPGTPPIRAAELAAPFFGLAGAPLPSKMDPNWTDHVERVFYRLARPLYGVT